jgi:hypothetical protein
MQVACNALPDVRVLTDGFKRIELSAYDPVGDHQYSHPQTMILSQVWSRVECVEVLFLLR